MAVLFLVVNFIHDDWSLFTSSSNAVDGSSYANVRIFLLLPSSLLSSEDPGVQLLILGEIFPFLCDKSLCHWIYSCLLTRLPGVVRMSIVNHLALPQRRQHCWILDKVSHQIGF